MNHAELTPDEQAQFATLFQKAMGIPLTLPSKFAIQTSTNAAYFAEVEIIVRQHYLHVCDHGQKYQQLRERMLRATPPREVLPFYFDPAQKTFDENRFIKR